MISVQWCSICNKRPADGQLTVLVEEETVTLPACEPCVSDPKKVEFIEHKGVSP